MKNLMIAGLILSSLVLFTACPPTMQEREASKSGAEAVKQIERVPKNSAGKTVEQQNIEDRVKVTTDPSRIMWIHLIALDGRIIRRMPVRNKVTSSGKRLEPNTWDRRGEFVGQEPPEYAGRQTNEYIQPDGTFGSSDPYIYWFDPLGRYHQWGTAGGLGYLLTDYPIDLSNPVDEITGLYRAHEAASKWQKEQEAKLKK